MPADVRQAPQQPLSAVIPVHNESHVVAASLCSLLRAVSASGLTCEIVLCENGSTDDTLQVLRTLEQSHPEVRVESLPTANYGLALKHAITACTHDTVVIFNIDFWSIDFVERALLVLRDSTTDVVVGSKAMPGAADERPLVRRLITGSFNRFLRVVFGFTGTDTHGLKAFRRAALLPVLHRCVTDHWILDTELVLRSSREGLNIVEIPVGVRELRQPTYRAIVERVPRVISNLARLWWALDSDRK